MRAPESDDDFAGLDNVFVTRLDVTDPDSIEADGRSGVPYAHDLRRYSLSSST